MRSTATFRRAAIDWPLSCLMHGSGLFVSRSGPTRRRPRAATAQQARCHGGLRAAASATKAQQECYTHAQLVVVASLFRHCCGQPYSQYVDLQALLYCYGGSVLQANGYHRRRPVAPSPSASLNHATWYLTTAKHERILSRYGSVHGDHFVQLTKPDPIHEVLWLAGRCVAHPGVHLPYLPGCMNRYSKYSTSMVSAYRKPIG